MHLLDDSTLLHAAGFWWIYNWENMVSIATCMR